MPDDPYAFDRFPRADLMFRYNRREFWSALRNGFHVKRAETHGGHALTLNDLGTWPDERLGELIPEIVPGCEIDVQDDLVYATPPNAPPVRLFPLDAPALFAFNGFNGRNLLGEVSRDLARHTGWDSERSFAYVRGLFLTLVMSGVCQPKY